MLASCVPSSCGSLGSSRRRHLLTGNVVAQVTSKPRPQAAADDAEVEEEMWLHLGSVGLNPWYLAFHMLGRAADPGEVDDGRERVYVQALSLSQTLAKPAKSGGLIGGILARLAFGTGRKQAGPALGFWGAGSVGLIARCFMRQFALSGFSCKLLLIPTVSQVLCDF